MTDSLRTPFDPLAVALSFDERWCKVEPMLREVDGKGLTRVAPGKPQCPRRHLHEV